MRREKKTGKGYENLRRKAERDKQMCWRREWSRTRKLECRKIPSL